MINSSAPVVRNAPIHLSSSGSGSSSTTIKGSSISLTPSTGNVVYTTAAKDKEDGSSLSVSLNSEDRQDSVIEKSKTKASINNYPYFLAGLIGGIIIFVLLIIFLWLRKR